jgi:HEAT repeat protein
MQMVAAFASMNAVKELTEIVKTEQDAAVRQRAIRGLGGQAGSETGRLLVDLYGAETNDDVRRAVIGALAAQDNAEALVAIARKESSIRLKTEIVGKLSEMAARSKVAADYLMEIIK